MGLKIFSSFISVMIIFIVTFLTFFSAPEKKLDYYSKFQIPSNGLFSIIRDKNGDFTEIKENDESQIILERFDYLDKIFFNKKGSYKKTQTSNATSLKVGKGKFFFSFSYPKKYVVSGSGFNISFIGPIKIFINTEDEEKIDVFSLDNVAELSLLSLENGSEKTKVYIYPHMYFTFKLRLNKILLNNDFYRIIQLNDGIGYVNQGLYTNDYNLDNFTYIDNYFFRSILSYFSNEYLNNKSNDSVLKENYNNVPYDYIKKYFYIFINDNKKITYYQDLIYMDLLKIYMSPKSGDYLFTDIEDYYKNLKLLSKKDYTEMLKVLLYFKSKFLLSNKIESIEAELKYDKILSSVFSFQKIEGDYMLYYIFNLYDLGNKDNFFDGLISFTDTYFKKNGLKIQKDKLLGYDKTKNIKLGYYISFLDNIIKSYLISNSNNSEEIKGVFSILNKYALLSVSVYSDGDKDKKRTIIVLHLNLLKALSEYIRNNFFEKEMDKGIMLVKNKELILDQSIISLLEKSYNTLFNFFTANKVAFDENIESDSLNLNDYDYLSLNYIEYLSALTNYDKYKIAKSDLYRIETIGGDNVKKIIYTVGDIKTYLENFNGVKSESIDIKTDETGNIYSVSINIGGKDFSFDLSPYNNYSISNIYLDGVKKNSTYSLNLIKEKMDQKFESATNEKEKNTNDFRNFFINTFLYKPNPVTPPTDEDPILPKETTDIMVFKRDKLLGSRGEFSNILDFAQIRPENIIVNIINQKISIKVRNVKTSSTYNLGNESNTYGTIFDSDYSIAVNEHYFNNAKFKLYKNIKDGNRVTEYYGLGEDKYIVINGNIGIGLFKEYISSLVSYYNYIIFVNDVLVKKVGQIDISVNSSKIVKYSFMYSGKNYEILLLKNSIISIKRDGEKINSSTLDYTELQNRIDLFIK